MFSISCALATAIKPSFAVCFLPVMAVFLLRDWIKNRFKGFLNIFLFGLSAIPSVAIGIMQATVLSGAEYGSYISFMRVLHVFSAHPYISIFVSVVLPVIAFILIGGYLFKFEDVKIILFAFLLGVLQAILISETGKGSNDGTYIWGALSMNYFLFAVVALRSWQWCKEKFVKGKTKKASDVIIGILLWSSFALHTFSGIKYFIMLLQGGYFL